MRDGFILRSMRLPISQRELEEVRTEVKDLQLLRVQLGRQLGEIMSSSGSYAAKTPGFPETEDRIRVVERTLGTLQQLLATTEPVRSAADLPHSRIGLYSKIIARGDDGQERRYYICHRSSPSSLVGFQAVTPSSPIGQALLGRAVGDVVEVALPRGTLELLLSSVEVEL